MSEQYLILHKVRGEPSFDCATKIRCPNCESARQGLDYGNDYAGSCTYCDDGVWWITNSGYRAYPYQHWALTSLEGDVGQGYFAAVADEIPDDWPDHFQVSGEKPPPAFNIMSMLDKVMPKIRRRI